MNTNNYSKDSHKRQSIQNKIRVLSIPSNKIKMVLVQQHEIDRLKLKNRKKLNDHEYQYVEQLYDHYITKNLPKTYLN